MPDRAAIVTGASSGIGLAIAKMLGEEGYGVTMTARRPEKLEGAVAELASDGLEAHGVARWTQSMIKELSPHGIKSTALCPAFVDTPMTDFVKEHVAPDQMIRPEDIAESVRFLLRVSPACVVPELMFIRPGDQL